MADEEYLDVVDENDNLIRTATFAEVKEKGLRRRTVNVMIADSGLDRVALALRSRNQKSSPNKWHVTAGGHLNSGETYEQAAYRETLEELFRDEPPQTALKLIEIARFRNDVPAKRKFEYTSFLYAVHSGPFFPDKNETEEIIWRDSDEVIADLARNPDKYTATMGIVMPYFESHRRALGKI